MQDLNDKVTSGSLTAAEWNEVPSELQNIITDWGQALSSGDLNQLAKGVAAYAAASTFYTGSGPDGAYIATPITGIQSPPNYFDGMEVRFRVVNANTGVSTVNVNGLGVKNIFREDGAALAPNDLISTRDTHLRYNSSAGNFRLSRWSSDELVALQGSPANLKIGQLTRTDAATITLSPGTNDNIVMTVNGKILTRSTDLIYNFTKLDTGSELASTAYYMYIDDVAGVMTAVVSASAPVLPTEAGKVGYHPTRTDELCIGGFWNNVLFDIVPTIWTPDGMAMFTEHDADHGHDLIELPSIAWRNEVVKIPETASGVLISASAQTPTVAGGIFFAADGATGTIPANGVNPTIAAFKNSLMYAINAGGGDIKGSSVHGEIPIVTPATPAISYVSTFGLSNFFMIVRGYRDIFSPRI